MSNRRIFTTSEQITLRVPRDLLDALRTRREAGCGPVSDQIVAALRDWLERQSRQHQDRPAA